MERQRDVRLLTLTAPPRFYAWGVLAALATAAVSDSTLTPIGVLEILCVVTYVLPRTTVLGAGC